MCKNCEQLTKRVDALEKIIKPNSITLTNSQDANEQILIEYNGEFKTKKLTTTVAEEELGSTTGL